MSDPRLKDIADALVTRLAAITTGGGYNFDAGITGIGPLSADFAGRSGANPAALVDSVSFTDRRHETFSVDSTDGNAATAALVLKLYTFGTTAHADMYLWAKDCVAAIEVAPDTLGLTYIDALTVTRFEQSSADDASESPQSKADLTVEITYRMSRGEI